MLDRNRDFISSARRRWLGLLVELRIERDDAAVGVLELAVSCTSSSWRSRSSSSVRSSSRFCCWISSIGVVGGLAARLVADPRELAARRRTARAAAASSSALTTVPQPDVELDLELVHEPARADDAQAHAGRATGNARRGSSRVLRCPGRGR